VLPTNLTIAGIGVWYLGRDPTDATTAGIFVGRASTDSALSIVIDYVAPPYRHLKPGARRYGHDAARFAEPGYRVIVVEQVDPRQRDDFVRMGFHETEDGMLIRTVGEG
jgi:hypothetical protein